LGFNISTDGYVLPLSLEDSVIQGTNHDVDYMIGCTIDADAVNPEWYNVGWKWYSASKIDITVQENELCHLPLVEEIPKEEE